MSALRVLQALCRCETTEEEEAEESEFDEEDAFAVTTLVHQGLLDASPAVRAVAAQVLSTLPTTEREMVSLVALGGDDDDVKKSVLALDDGLLEKYAAIWVEDEVATMEVAVDE